MLHESKWFKLSLFILSTTVLIFIQTSRVDGLQGGKSRDWISHEFDGDDDGLVAKLVEDMLSSPLTSGSSLRDKRLARPIAYGAVDTLPPEERTKCRKFILVMAKRLMKIFNGCVQEVKGKYPEKEEFASHFQCVIKCSMQKVHMLDEGYGFSNTTFAVFVKEHIPEDFHPLTYRLCAKCITEFTELVKKDDPLCTIFGNYIKCMQDIVADQCKSEDVKL